MDFMRIVPLLLILLSRGHMQQTTQTNKCQNCPAGFYKAGECTNLSALDHCKPCDNGTFTDKENQLKCSKCKICESHEVEKQNCDLHRNRVCECGEGYYLNVFCHSCIDDRDCNHQDYLRKCCQSNMSMKCKECNTIKDRPSTSTMKTTTLSTVPANNSHSGIMIATSPAPTGGGKSSTTPAILTKDQAPNNWNVVTWLLLMVTVVTTLVVLHWLLLLITRKKCPYWSTSKDLETPAQNPKSNEQCSHQDSSPATLSFSFSEETPMMTFCQKPPPHNSNHLLGSDRMVSCEVERRKQDGLTFLHSSTSALGEMTDQIGNADEQSACWPAIVLYAIIKEVPLRRWKEFLRLLSVADQEMERVELEAGLGSIERQYQMLRLWSQRSSASLNDVYSSLQYMDLSGCAQQLQENLEKLQWRPEAEQGLTA